MTIIQIPNIPLIVAISGFIASKITTGLPHNISFFIYTVALIIWALEEITSGVNWFRRLLGVVVFLWVAYLLLIRYFNII